MKLSVVLALIGCHVHFAQAFQPILSNRHAVPPIALPGKLGLQATTLKQEVDTKNQVAGVTYTPSTHRLYYVPSIDDIDYNAVGVPANDFMDVPAFQLENNKGVKIKAMAKGANMVELSLDGNNFVWENIEGACYYGAGTNNFPLQRGLVLNGGIRFAAVTAEHGLYYDIDWDVTVDYSNPDEKSIIFLMVDNEENRERAKNHIPKKPANAKPANAKPTPVPGFSSGQYNHLDIDGKETEGFMTRYPTTNMDFRYKITLRKDEDFVRLKMSVKNEEATPKIGEAWLPMTFPITGDSTILSHQELRWRRDNWCFDYMTPNIVKWDDYPIFDKPLDWPTGGIFYYFPRKNGRFHGVTTNPEEGKGVVYYAPDDITKPAHYTKMWSWGKKSESGGGASSLTAGRPASEYYEPWSSGVNFAFFQTKQFEPMEEVSWEVAVLPITEGLTSPDKKKLLEVVDAKIDERMDKLGDIQGVETTGVGKKSA